MSGAGSDGRRNTCLEFTRGSLSIIFKKGIKLDGSHPTLLVGYGAYSITIDPFFSPRWLAWYERDGVIAVAQKSRQVFGVGAFRHDAILRRILRRHIA